MCTSDGTNHFVEFDLKPDAKPVAWQPIPLSPFDEARVEYHVEENVWQGKLRKIDTVKEGLPDFSTPVFVVDQDAKGMLGRMVCAYGPVNKDWRWRLSLARIHRGPSIEQQARSITLWWTPSGDTRSS